MNSLKIEVLNNKSLIQNDDEFSIPMDISDILNICKEYADLTSQIQSQIENMLEIGLEESLNTGVVKISSLPYIKYFLNKICENPYFGDAVSQSKDLIDSIKKYEDLNKSKIIYN